MPLLETKKKEKKNQTHPNLVLCEEYISFFYCVICLRLNSEPVAWQSLEFYSPCYTCILYQYPVVILRELYVVFVFFKQTDK